MDTRFLVQFAVHMPRERVAEMSCTLTSYGEVKESDAARAFEVVVGRPKALERLETELRVWETHGFVRWERSNADKHLF